MLSSQRFNSLAVGTTPDPFPDFVTYILRPNVALDYQTFHAEPQRLLSRRDDTCERMGSQRCLRPYEESAESRRSVEAAPGRRAQRVVHRWRQPRREERGESCIGGDSLGGERAESRASVETASERLNFS